jgi:hypothetical protein
MPARRKSAKTESWSACKPFLQSLSREKLIALIKELHGLSEENERFLHARLVPDTRSREQRLADTMKQLKRMLSPDAMLNDEFRHIDVKRVIDQFQKAVKDPHPVAALLLGDLAISLRTFSEVADVVRMVDHIYATMNRLEKTMLRLDLNAATPLIQELCRLAQEWENEFGYGISDELFEMADDWRRRVVS